MKLLAQNRVLSVAVAASLIIHGIFLSVRFVPPEAFRVIPADTSLEVILVNAKHDKKPVKADAVAQANLDGGGTEDKGHAKSPLPSSNRTPDGNSLASTQKTVRELQEQQKALMAKLKQKMPLDANAKTALPDNAADENNDKTQLTNRAAQIERNIEEQNKRPKKTFITPSTREVGYAMYYKAMQKKIESIGTLNFPEDNGKRLYGELIVYIPVFHDGTLYEKEGGPRIQRSSGIPALDNAALKIVRRAAPFGAFPANMRSGNGGDLWVIVTRFKFTREQGLETQLRS